MKKNLLYIAAMLLMVIGLSACDQDEALPPAFYPEEVGDGTGTAPYNVGTALLHIYKGDYTSKQVFVKGIVSQVTEFNASYGNITYYISDDGTKKNELEVYRGLGLNGDKFTAMSDLKVGDSVIICCTLTYYNNQYAETGQGAVIVSLNGSDWTPDPVVDPAGTGVKEDPYNVTKALEVILGDNCPKEKVYVKGKISKIESIDINFGNAVYYISDTGSTFTQLEIYRGYSLGGAKFKSTTEIKVGDEVTVYGQVVNFNGTPEFTTGSMITVLNGQENDPNTGGPTAEPKGAGTKDDPYNAAMALKVANELAADASTPDKVYVEGIVSSIKEVNTQQFGNATYAISDGGGTNGEFSIFRGYYLGGDKFTAEDQIKVGDKVVVLGNLTNFKGNTPQMAQGSQIVSLNGQGGGDTPQPGTTDPKGDGTETNPYNAAMALKVATELAADATTPAEVYVEGIVSSIKEVSAQFGNATYAISDNGTAAGEFSIFRGYYLGGEKFTSADQLKVGDKVLLLGKLVNYKGNTPQMNQGGKIVKINDGGGQGGGGDEPDTPSGPIDATSADFNTFNNSTANTMNYGTYKSAQGWVTTWCLILAGGTEATNFISADAKTLFPCIDGTPARPGKLTSPAINGGIKTLTFNYGFPYNETKVAFTVNILQDGKVVATDKVTIDAPEKGKVYNYSHDFNVKGVFTIEIVNDCLSQATVNNKDRVAIWDLKWTK